MHKRAKVLGGIVLGLIAIAVYGLAHYVSNGESVSTIGYQLAIRTSEWSGNNNATAQNYSSLNPQSFFTGRKLLNTLANEIVVGEKSEMGKAKMLLTWEKLHIRPQTEGPTTVIGDDYVNIVKRGWGYCDQMAHVFATFANFVGIDSRQFQLTRSNGVSPHTFAEIKIDDRWIVVDPWMGIIPTDASGQGVTVEELGSSIELREHFGYEQLGLGTEVFMMGKRFVTYPYISNLSTLVKIATKVPSKIISKFKTSSVSSDSHSAVTPGAVTPGAVVKSIAWSVAEMTLFDEARVESLKQNFPAAIEKYKILISASKNDSVIESSLYFLTLAQIDSGLIPSALVSISNSLRDYPESPWSLALWRLQAELALKSGNVGAAKELLTSIASPQSTLALKMIDSNK